MMVAGGSTARLTNPQSRALDGLPPKFVTAMRTLFDVLDDNKTGCGQFNKVLTFNLEWSKNLSFFLVSLSDIEQWWRRDREEQGGSGGLETNGVIECLK